MTTWNEFTDLRFDYLLLRDHEPAALEILWEHGTEEKTEHTYEVHMPWREFLTRFERELPAGPSRPGFNLHIMQRERLANILQTPSRYRALYTERVGSGWRIITDLQPQTDPEERAETSEEDG